MQTTKRQTDPVDFEALAEMGARLEIDRLTRRIETLYKRFPGLTTAQTPQEAPRRTGGRPKGYKTTPATRAKLRAAWKRRKAAQVKH